MITNITYDVGVPSKENYQNPELFLRAKNGDEEAKLQFSLNNAGLVYSVVNGLRSLLGPESNSYLDDLIGAGLTKFLPALIPKYDSTITTFANYAIKRLHFLLLDYFFELSHQIPIPYSTRASFLDRLDKLEKTKTRLMSENGVEPTLEEITKAANCASFAVRQAQLNTIDRFVPLGSLLRNRSRRLGSRDGPRIDSSDISYTQHSRSAEVQDERTRLIEYLIDKAELNYNQEQVLRRNVLCEKEERATLEDLGVELGGISKARVHEIKNIALTLLRKTLIHGLNNGMRRELDLSQELVESIYELMR